MDNQIIFDGSTTIAGKGHMALLTRGNSEQSSIPIILEVGQVLSEEAILDLENV